MSDTSVKLAVGGDVQAKGGTYLKRPADDDLFEACLTGQFSFVLACRQIGKSSLKNAVAERLIARDIKVARIDLNRIGQSVEIAEDWYFTLLDEIARTLGLETSVEDWWESKSHRLTLNQRFLRFFDEVVLTEINRQMVIFIDEIDMTLGLPFTDDFFAAIRVIHNDRAQNPAYKRLTFVLLGVATPDELINDNNRTPFNIGRAITVEDFSLAECAPLSLAIKTKHPTEQSDLYFQQIYEWTQGHPYLTQKLCEVVANLPSSKDLDLNDNLIKITFLTSREHTEDNLRFVQTRVLNDPYRFDILRTYKKILQGKTILDDEKSLVVNRLKLYGLVIAKNGRLTIRNRIYRNIFNLAWVESNIPFEFEVGGALSRASLSYVKRSADDELFNYIIAGKFCCVLAPRQMGKSSLMVHCAQRLRQYEIHTAIIDLTGIGTGTSVEAWYISLLLRLKIDLHLSIEVADWWETQGPTSTSDRFIAFLRDIILDQVKGSIVIFIDEIDTILALDFSTEDFFTALRTVYDGRVTENEFRRLTFVILGVVSKSDLTTKGGGTFLDISRAIELKDFNQIEAAIFQARIRDLFPNQDQIIFRRIYYWTNGHPYLTQKLCHSMVNSEGIEYWSEQQIDNLVENLFFAEKSRITDHNLSFVQNTIMWVSGRHQLLALYRKVYQGVNVRNDEQSNIQNYLKLSGLVKVEGEYLCVRNEIYRRVFDLAWIQKNTTNIKRQVRVLVGTALVAIIMTLIVIVSLFLLTPRPNPVVATVIDVSNIVYIVRKGDNESITAKFGQYLYQGDRIVTESNATILIFCTNGHVYQVKEADWILDCDSKDNRVDPKNN